MMILYCKLYNTVNRIITIVNQRNNKYTACFWAVYFMCSSKFGMVYSGGLWRIRDRFQRIYHIQGIGCCRFYRGGQDGWLQYSIVVRIGHKRCRLPRFRSPISRAAPDRRQIACVSEDDWTIRIHRRVPNRYRRHPGCRVDPGCRCRQEQGFPGRLSYGRRPSVFRVAAWLPLSDGLWCSFRPSPWW